MEEDEEKILLGIMQLSSPADRKGQAVQYLLEMTGTEEGCTFIISRGKLLDALLKLLFDNNTAIRDNVRKCVVNLTADEKSVRSLVSQESSLKEVMVNLLKQCLDPKTTNNLICCILTNITRVSEGALLIAGIVLDSSEVGLSSIVDALCSLHANKGETLSSLSMLLMNLTQVPSVRRKLLAAPSPLFLRLLPIISFSTSLSSCKGIVGAVKNCCFEYDSHSWLLSEEVDLLPRLLLPLAGPEEFDEDDMERLPPDLQYLPDTKEREADPQVRGMLIQAIHKLCSTKAGRLMLKEKNVYVILRELHKWETSEENIESILKVIDILIADEPQEGMEELHAVEVPPHLEKAFDQEEMESKTK